MPPIDFGACFPVLCRTSAAADGVRSQHAAGNHQGSHGGHEEAVVEVGFEQAPHRQYPGDIQVEYVDIPEESLVHCRVCDARNCGELYRDEKLSERGGREE